MGAFLLCDVNETDCYSRALGLFAEMGFSAPDPIELDHWRLYVFRKMISEDNRIVQKNDCKLASVGSLIYKGLNCTDSLSVLLDDYLSGSIDFNQLIGQYTVLFVRPNRIEILRDQLAIKHLFSNQKHTVFSSHMLPLCQSFSETLHINKTAVYEKFLTGIIMSPNTIFEEVLQVDHTIEKKINETDTGIHFLQDCGMPSVKDNTHGMKESITDQAKTLQKYFESLRNVGADGIDIGLSGGYDSRLVLACLHKFYKGRLHLHSHATEKVHAQDLKIAQSMADHVHTPCHIVPTKTLCHSANIEKVLRKSVLYFDGRSSYSIGGCGEVYTAEYRKVSTESTPITMTGVGGEVYRNIFDISRKRIRFDRFMETKVFSKSFQRAVSEKIYEETTSDIINRAAYRLRIDRDVKQSKQIAHRYYCEIMMPDGQGVALDAYNQVSSCFAPFLESKIIAKGYETIPFQKSGGEFEGKLIDYIDSELASLPSSYGYPLNCRPLSAKFKETLRTYISLEAWGTLSNLLHGKREKNNNSIILERLIAGSSVIKQAYEYICSLFPEIDFIAYCQSEENIRRVQFVAVTLFMLRERINQSE